MIDSDEIYPFASVAEPTTAYLREGDVIDRTYAPGDESGLTMTKLAEPFVVPESGYYTFNIDTFDGPVALATVKTVPVGASFSEVVFDVEDENPFVAYRGEPGFIEHDAATCAICQEAGEDDEDDDEDDVVDKCDWEECPLCWPEAAKAAEAEVADGPTPVWEQDLGDDTDRDVEMMRRALLATAADFTTTMLGDLPVQLLLGGDYARGYRDCAARAKESFELFGDLQDGEGFHRRFREAFDDFAGATTENAGAESADAGGVTVVSDATSGVVTQ